MSDLVPLSAVTGTPVADTTASSGPEPTNQLDKDAFLQLLVAQLRYQNPLSPSDPNQFMAQTAQFTMVEKLTALADDVSRQRVMTETQLATSTLGREVTWLDDDGAEQTGVVTGTSFRATGPVLTIDGQEVPLDRLLAVNAPTQSATNPTTNEE